MLFKLKTTETYALRNIPDNYKDQFKDLNIVDKNPDLIYGFVDTLEDMKKEIKNALNELKPGGLLCLMYPKLKNTLGKPGIHRDDIFPFLKVNSETGYIDQTLMRFNRMQAFDDQYTLIGIKKDTSQKLRKEVLTSKSDIDNFIKEFIELIQKETDALAFFNTLPNGYQKQWVRYVFDVKTDETKQKRLKETIYYLNNKIKAKTLVKKDELWKEQI